MKGIFLTSILLLLLGAGAAAQVQQGTIVINGHLGYRHNSTETDKPANLGSERTNYSINNKENQFFLRPSVGYLINDNLEVGLSLGYGSIKWEHNGVYNIFEIEKDYTSRSTSSSFFISPYLQKYIFVTDKFAFLGIASLSYGKSNSKYVSPDAILDADNQKIHLVNRTNHYTSHYLIGTLAPGIAIFISERINLSATFGALHYSKNKSKSYVSDGSTRSGNSEYAFKHFGFSVSPQYFNFGLSYFVGR